MMKLFKRKPKEPVPATAPVVELDDTPPTDATDAAEAPPTPWGVDEMIRVEEHWQDGTLVVRAELPGIDPDKDVHVTVADGRLTIEAERYQQDEVERDGFVLHELRSGRFSRSLPLAPGVSAASITATYRDGLLEVRVPDAAVTPEPPAVRIPITTS